MTHRVRFRCNGAEVEVVDRGSLLEALREQLGLRAAKDGCAPQGQCGCCTVLVDGRPRLACVTPPARVAGREVTTFEGLAPEARDRLVDAFVAAGASQCGFCTPGIVVRLAPLVAGGRAGRAEVDRALAAHLCRCTGWQTIREAAAAAAGGGPAAAVCARPLEEAAARATLEAGVAQRVGPDVVAGDAGFADDRAPADALVAVPAGPEARRGGGVELVEAAGIAWVLAPTWSAARAAAGWVPGRRSGAEVVPPLEAPTGTGVVLRTGWVEPAYLEPDASSCVPGGEPASPLANGGAFGGKVRSPAPVAAAELAGRCGRPVRVCLTREDVVRLGPKRPPVAAVAALVDGAVEVRGRHAATVEGTGPPPAPSPWRRSVRAAWEPVRVPGPPVSWALRAAGWAEQAVLVHAALRDAGINLADELADDRAAAALLNAVALAPSGAAAGAAVDLDPATALPAAVRVRVAAGDVLDEVTLRSYAIGAVHMALGWVLSEGLAVDASTGECRDLTIRSWRIIPARHMPEVEVTFLDDPGPARAGADAVFVAVAAAVWDAVAALEGERPRVFPARASRTGRMLAR
jgi:aerobic-type carbon monoxide dehydrogenase small subunit (CoxS/CutS family)